MTEERKKFRPGTLHLKKRVPAAGKEEDASEEEDLVDQMTEVEARFLSVHRLYQKREMTKLGLQSFDEQKKQLDERLKSYPMHNEMEGD